jgi:hypothetical protein
MSSHPENTVAKYTTRLPSRIDLTGDWEVGLVEITYPRSYFNIDNDDCVVEVCEGNKNWISGDERKHRKYTIPNGYYSNIRSVIDTLNHMMVKNRESTKVIFKFKGFVNIKIDDLNTIVILSDELVRILGFTDRRFYEGEHVASSAPDLRRRYFLIYVYCDLVESTTVGDVRVPLLRTVVDNDKRTEIAYVSYVNPIYVPLQKRHFDTVDINIMTDEGKPVPFTNGKSLVVLHFRRSSDPYLLLSK